MTTNTKSLLFSNLNGAMGRLGAAYITREISGDHYTAENFQELKDSQEAIREIARQIDGECWNDGLKQGLDLGRSSFRNLLIELLAAEDAMGAFLVGVDHEAVGEEEWRKQHAERSQRKTAAIQEARAAIAADPGRRACLDEKLNQLRQHGWTVAVHNDYRLDGRLHTFWLFTHHNGRWAKGEGVSDLGALEEVEACIRETVNDGRRELEEALEEIASLMDVADNALDRDTEEDMRKVYDYDPPDDAEFVISAKTRRLITVVFECIEKYRRYEAARA